MKTRTVTLFLAFYFTYESEKIFPLNLLDLSNQDIFLKKSLFSVIKCDCAIFFFLVFLFIRKQC